MRTHKFENYYIETLELCVFQKEKKMNRRMRSKYQVRLFEINMGPSK